MINWKECAIIHIKPWWPLRCKHRCTKFITTVSKKIKYPLPLKILHSITKRFNIPKYHDIEYRNLPTPNIHKKGRTILHLEQPLPKTHKLPVDSLASVPSCTTYSIYLGHTHLSCWWAFMVSPWISSKKLTPITISASKTNLLRCRSYSQAPPELLPICWMYLFCWFGIR